MVGIINKFHLRIIDALGLAPLDQSDCAAPTAGRPVRQAVNHHRLPISPCPTGTSTSQIQCSEKPTWIATCPPDEDHHLPKDRTQRTLIKEQEIKRHPVALSCSLKHYQKWYRLRRNRWYRLAGIITKLVPTDCGIKMGFGVWLCFLGYSILKIPISTGGVITNCGGGEYNGSCLFRI